MAAGWVIIDKALMDFSMKTTQKVKRWFGAKKAGHAGTLDPLATGILPIALDSATTLLPIVMGDEKTYTFTVAWGQATTTEDCLGEVCEESPHRPSLGEIEAILPSFLGKVQQVPPIYSALKIAGQRAYEKARKGERVSLAPRSVVIHHLGIEDYALNQVSFTVTCSTGTYVRALARDLALALGTLGHVTALRRTRVGPFTEGWTLDFLEKKVHKEEWIYPPQKVLTSWDSYDLSAEETQALWQGRAIPFSEAIQADGKAVACYGPGQHLVALAQAEKGYLRPFRCFLGEL